MSKITYTNKVDLYEDTSIADINKVKASDMNEIKTVVNNNDDTTTNNTNAIGTLSELTTTNKNNLVDAINEVNTKHIASISCNTFTSKDKKTYVPADNFILLGSKLTIANNKIIVGSGVSRVKVSGNAIFNTSNTNYTMNVEIDLHVNQIEVKRTINYAGVTRYAFCSFSETIINVTEGDEIQLQVWNNSAANYSIDGKGTWLTVEVIE